MQIDRLFLNGKEVDLSPNTVIAITFQINDLAELKDRQGNFTNQFKIPLTATNRDIFEDAELLQSGTRKPYTKLRARVVKNGVDVLKAGFAFMENTESGYYNITVYSGIIDFFESIRDLKISDLDTTSIDPHIESPVTLGPSGVMNPVNNFALIVDSRANTWVQGWKYPLIDYGKFPTGTRDIYNMWLRPAAFYKAMINIIHSNQGWDYEWSQKTSTLYENLLLPYADTDVDNRDLELFYFWYSGNLIMQMTPNALGGISVKPLHKYRSRIKGQVILNWNGINRVTIFTTATNPIIIGNAVLSGTYDFDSGYVETTGSVITPDIKLEYGGGTTFETELNNVIYEVIDDTTGESHRIWLQHGRHTALSNYGPSTLNINQQAYPLSEIFGSLKQSDLIKALFQMYGIIAKCDSSTKTVYWKTFKEIIDAKPQAKDWSDKLDMDEGKWKLEYRYGKYGQFNSMNYDKDEDVDEQFIIDNGIDANDGFNIDDEILDETVQMFKLPFGISNTITTLNGLITAQIKRSSSPTLLNAYDVDVLPRILIDNTQASISGAGIKYQIAFVGSVTKTTDIPLCYFYVPAAPYNLTLQYFKDNFYAELIEVLQNKKKLTAWFNLTEVDIAEYDPFIPVYIRQLSSYFYINKIPQYTGKGLTKVELIKI